MCITMKSRNILSRAVNKLQCQHMLPQMLTTHQRVGEKNRSSVLTCSVWRSLSVSSRHTSHCRSKSCFKAGSFCFIGFCNRGWTVCCSKSKYIWEAFATHLFSLFWWQVWLLWCHFLFDKVFACRKQAGTMKLLVLNQWRCRGSGRGACWAGL